MDMSVIVNPIAMLFIAICIGFVSAKTGYLQDGIRKIISTIIVKITLPLMIITSLMEKDITGDTAGWFLQLCELVCVAFAVLAQKIF